MKRRYNWKPDKRDHRDHIMHLAPHAQLPRKVDLRENCSPVFNQGDEGSCTAHAGAGIIEYLALQAIKKNESSPEILGEGKFASASRQFIYYNERVIEDSVNEDAGAQIRDCVKALAKYGVCREDLWKYEGELNEFTKPGDAVYAEAAKHKITKYARLLSLDQMKATLAHGHPFMFGIFVYESFESDEVAATGKVPMPQAHEQCLGGHAVMCVGYDDDMECVIMRNSWGADWGDKGYFYLPYAFVTNPNLSEDFWVIQQ